MRHRIRGRSLGRDPEHQVAMRRNLVASLFQHETVSTTLPKAKEVKSFAEKLITLAKKGDLAARRRAISLLGNPPLVDQEDGEPIEKGTVIGKLFSELGPRYLDRPGGYTRIVKLSKRRLGDNGQLVLLQLLGADEKLEPKEKKAKADEKAELEKVVEAPENIKTEVNADESESQEKSPESEEKATEESGQAEESEEK